MYLLCLLVVTSLSRYCRGAHKYLFARRYTERERYYHQRRSTFCLTIDRSRLGTWTDRVADRVCSVLCMSVDNHAIVFTGRIMKFIINNRSSNKFNLKRPSGTVLPPR